jgi:hypothetical protein
MDQKKRVNKRYTFELPIEIYNQLAGVAEENGTSVVEMLRKYIKLGLLATKPGTEVLLRIGDSDQPVMLIL